MKKTNKILSIILAILMIATTIPMAFAADETPDFSDAKVLTSVDGVLYIDGEAAEKSGSTYVLPAGKYKLTGDISTDVPIFVVGEAVLDLNGYTWNMNNHDISLNAPLSVYDTSTDKTGKITSSCFDTIWLNNETGVFSLYGGTIENTSTDTESRGISAAWASANLYGGKIKSNGYAIFYYMSPNITINLDGTVLETGEGYAQIDGFLSVGSATSNAVIDVTDYKGESLTADVEIIDTVGKLKIFEGISAEESEKYTVNVTFDENSDFFFEKEEYDEATGEKYIYIAKNAFTQQPSVDNNYTVDFNNPATSFQWYEVEETVLTPENVRAHDRELFENGKWIVENHGVRLFTYDIKAGDILMVSTESDFERVLVDTGFDSLMLINGSTLGTMTFDSDASLDVWVPACKAENPIELEFSIVRETALDGETGETLQNPECGKSYYCKVIVGGKVYASDIVVGHIIASVPAKEKTCTTIGWDAYKYCTECDYTTYVEIPASHEIVNVEAKANTCTEIGWDAYEYCTECDYTTYDEKPILGHDIIVDAYVAPTCTQTGLTEGQHCSRCEDMTIAQETVPALGHINEDGDTLCDRCGETILCEDCGRPVHGESFFENLICMIIMFFNLIKSIFA